MPVITTCTRAADLRADASSSSRSVSAVLATENPVLVFDRQEGSFLEEVLRIDGCEIPSQVPMLLDHDRSIPSAVGSVRNIQAEGNAIVGRLFFADNQAGRDTWPLVEGRHVTDVSIGYRVIEATVLRPGETKIVRSRSYTAPPYRPLKVVTRWELKETSIVVIGADQAAKIRSEHSSTSERTNMHTATLPNLIGHRSMASMTLAQLSAAILRRRGEAVRENDQDTFRAAMSGVDGVDELAGIVGSTILGGYRGATDALSGIYRTIDLPNYLAAKLAAVGTPPRLEHVGRGELSPSISFSLDSRGTFRLARFGAQFCISEEDLEDSRTIGTYAIALAEVGAAARRMISDALFAVLLSNPNLADGSPLFGTGRGNYVSGGPSALDDASLDAGLAAIANQVGTSVDGQPAHYGLQAAYLVVAPEKLGVAQRLARTRATAAGELIVRADSRLSTGGVVDPRSGELLVGTETAWMLAAPGVQAGGLLLALLDGKAEPTIRSFVLDQGEWGIGFDVSFSCAAAATDGRGLYWSAGA